MTLETTGGGSDFAIVLEVYAGRMTPLMVLAGVIST